MNRFFVGGGVGVLLGYLIGSLVHRKQFPAQRALVECFLFSGGGVCIAIGFATGFAPASWLAWGVFGVTAIAVGLLAARYERSK